MYKYGTLAAGVPQTFRVSKDVGNPNTPINPINTSWQIEAGVADVVVESRLIGMTDFVTQTTVTLATTIILDLVYVAEFRVSSVAGGEFSLGKFAVAR